MKRPSILNRGIAGQILGCMAALTLGIMCFTRVVFAIPLSDLTPLKAEYIYDEGELSISGNELSYGSYDGPLFRPRTAHIPISSGFTLPYDGKWYTKEIAIDNSIILQTIPWATPIVHGYITYKCESPFGYIDAGAYYATSEVKYYAAVITKPGVRPVVGTIPVTIRGMGQINTNLTVGSKWFLIAESTAWAFTETDGLVPIGYANSGTHQLHDQFDNTIIFHVKPDVEQILLDIWFRVVADGMGYSNGPVNWWAEAFADPVIQIDPAYADDYTLVYSDNLPPAYKLPDTGQTLCYDSSGAVISCAGKGQDGEYSINPMSYIDNGSGMVTDNNTSLSWQKCSVGQNSDTTCSGNASTYNWYQASGTTDTEYNPSSQNVCGSLTTGNFNDWRLPTKQELLSIVDYSNQASPTINHTYFPNTQPYDYWTSTTCIEYPDHAWRVYFIDGSSDFYTKSYGQNNMYVRCVRGRTPTPDFSDNHDGTVTDNITGFMWQQGEPGTMTWDAALTYCNNLTIGIYSDWRLPNIKELASLIDDVSYNPTIDISFFPNAHADNYWSSTSTVYNPPYMAKGVYFADGRVLVYDYKSVAQYVRCVRGSINYCPANPIKIDGLTPYYSTIHDAYTAATEGKSIQMQALDFTETDLNLNKGISVTLVGGYDCDFSPILGYTTIHGTVTISGGAVTVENVTVQ